MNTIFVPEERDNDRSSGMLYFLKIGGATVGKFQVGLENLDEFAVKDLFSDQMIRPFHQGSRSPC